MWGVMLDTATEDPKELRATASLSTHVWQGLQAGVAAGQWAAVVAHLPLDPHWSSPILSQAITSHLPAFLAYFFLLLFLFNVFCQFRIPPFLCVLTFLSLLSDLCGLFLLFLFCLGIVLRTFTSLYVGRCWCSLEKLTITQALFVTWSDSLWNSVCKQVLLWFKSSDCNGKEHTSPQSYSLWKVIWRHSKTFNKHCSPTPHPVLIFPSFFSLAVFTPVLQYDHTCNGVVFTFLCSLNQQQVYVLLASLHTLEHHQHMSTFIAHILLIA